MEASEYLSKAFSLFEELFPGGHAILTFSSAAEVRLIKARFNQGKKELKQVKREIAQELQAINATYADKRANHAGFDIGHAFAASLFGSKSRSKGLARRNNQLRKEQLAMQEPYKNVSRRIDDMVLQIDQAILKIDTEWLAAQQRRQVSETSSAVEQNSTDSASAE